MDETQLRLDGNAAAGILREVFVHDVSAARGACACCGTIARLGSQHLYMYPRSPGGVLGCQPAVKPGVGARPHLVGEAVASWIDAQGKALAAAGGGVCRARYGVRLVQPVDGEDAIGSAVECEER